MENQATRFTGKVAIVSGGADGMGAECVERLAAEGARVFALDLNADKAELLAARLVASGRKVEAMRANVLDDAELTAAIKTAEAKAGQVDILINIAGGDGGGIVAETDPAIWDRLFKLNVRSTVVACRAVLPAMRRQGRGSIVNMGSISGLRGDPGWAPYNSAKAGVISLTQSLAWEEGRYGIRVNAICPGPTGSRRLMHALPDGMVEAIGRSCALGRMGSPAELAAAILFLASDDASYITGVPLVVDGGLTARTGQPDYAPPQQRQ